jgi:hypothetical protein
VSAYEIVVQGRMSRRSEPVRDGARVLPGCGHTTMLAEVIDQAELYGLLNRPSALGIELISVNRATRPTPRG